MASRFGPIGAIRMGRRLVGCAAGSRSWSSDTAPRTYATKRLTLPAAEVRRLYRGRTPSEAVIRVCQDQRGLNGWQARTERAQRHHLTCCVVAFCGLERERHDRRLTIYKLKRYLSGHGRLVRLPALERLRQAA